MKQTGKRALALWLSGMFLFGLLGGCTPSEPDSGADGGATSSLTETSSTVTTTSTTQSSSAVSEDSRTEPSSTAHLTEGTKSSASSAKPTKTTKPTTKTTQSTTKTTRSTTKTTKPSSSTTTSTTKAVWENKVSDVGFGFYSLYDRTLENPDNEWSRLVCSDYVNTVFVWSAYELEGLREHHVKAWMYVNDVYNMARNGDKNWKKKFDELWQSFVDLDNQDSLLGWYLDEPSDMKTVKEVTKYAKETYGKRFLICFMVQTVAPDVWGGYIDENSHINKDNVQYLTDIAVDMYWQVKGNEKVYERLFAALHKHMADDAKVWYIPYAYSDYSILEKPSYEIWILGQNSVEHIRYMYEWLKKEPEKNRGGILVFAYDFDSPYEKIYSLYNINQLTDGKWNFVMDECIRIGREVCAWQ